MKVLIFTKNWLGDILFEIPAMEALRQNFPEAEIVALAPERCREILEAVPFLDRFHAFDERSADRSLLAKIRFIFWLRKEKFDKVFLFHRSFTRSFLALLGGIGERIGYETPKRRKILTTAVPVPSWPLHQVDYFLVILKWAGLAVRFGALYQFFFKPEEIEKAVRLARIHRLPEKAFVSFHIGANWEPKRWPASHFSKLADLVAEEFSCPIVLTGSEKDIPLAEEISRSVKKSKVISLCGKTSLGGLGALFQKAALMVSSDSGPLHIASGVGTSVIALFGPTCPLLTGPRGTGKKIILQFVPEGYTIPWKGKELPPGGWMERITPEQVMQRIRKENLWPAKSEKIFSSSH